ncbi:MAG: shikimate dehydrogenase [Bacteroidota bacterium]|nr:shikimate dehydrogenase [Bacteroidota bacterium]
MKKVFGLIGENIEHSFSKNYFEEKFKKQKLTRHKYINLDITDISIIKKLIQNYNIRGLNITSPYKEKVIPFLDKLSKDAQNIKSVNTIQIINNKLIGHNTDIIGFENSFLPILNNRRNILVLGNGGASKAIQFVLDKNNLNYQVVSRRLKLNYSKITKELIRKNAVIINTTCLGMYPDIKTLPELPYEALNSNHLLFDLVYNPKETLFLRNGKKQNTQIKNGYEMLKIQAETSWEIWNT